MTSPRQVRLGQLARENFVMFSRRLKEHIRVVTTAMAWSATGDNALVCSILANLGIADQDDAKHP
ncbi:MAG: hypothetical protein ABI081_05305 [Burkholderiaceae bacterium]